MTAANERLRAKWIFPSAGPPIENGVLTIVAGTITKIETGTQGSDIMELGNVAVIPALVNAHTHLEFSDLATPIGQRGGSFADWLKTVISHREAASPSSNAAIESGLQQCAAAGVAYVGEIATEPALPKCCSQSRVGGTRFLELIATSQPRISGVLSGAREYLHAMPNSQGWSRGLSPHAPYTTSMDLVEQAALLCRKSDATLAMHLAESREELELLTYHSGPLRELLESRDVWNAQAFPVGTRPLEYLKRLSHAPRSLVVHGNYLDDEELRFLANHADHMTLVYCPRTHAFFGHGEYPLARAIELGVSVALGTDSRASNPDLSLFNELQHAARLHPDVPAPDLLKAATNSQAFGFRNEIAVGKPFRFARIQLANEAEKTDPYEVLFDEGSHPEIAI